MAQTNNGHNTHVSPPRMTFLVGAGISIPVGIPAMKGIYSGFLNKEESRITDSELETCRFLTGRLEVEPDLEEILLAANAISNFRNSPLAAFVETSVSPRSPTNKLNEYRGRARDSARRVEAVRRRILDYLAKKCFEFDRDKAGEIFGGIVEAIATAGYPVFSTNYDFALEHVAVKRNIRVENNFASQGRGPEQRWVWDESISFPTGEALTLIKLHGSVNWYRDNTGLIENIPTDTRKNLAGRDVSRLLVFPTRFKDIYDQHFFALYSHFLSVLASAEVLIVAGHSLRDDYLRAGIIERFRQGSLHIVVVDPIFPKALPAELAPARPGKSGPIVHIPYRFEDIRDELAHLIGHSDPADISDHCSRIVRSFKRRSHKLSIRGNIRKLKAGGRKQFSARLEAQLLARQKPAVLRCWIESSGALSPITRSEFLDGANFYVEKGSRGIIQADIPIDIVVPENRNWAEEGTVMLKVGLLKPSVKRPGQIRRQDKFVLAEREYSYSSD